MKKTMLAHLLAGAFACAACAAQAQPVAQGAPSDDQPELDAVIVTGTPLGSRLFDFVLPADVLQGRALLERRQSTLGETLSSEPGISSTYFGPAVSRPIIRGLDADRIRILQNGVGTLDGSSLSFDHSVPYDPLSIERVETVRGPAAILYGGNAVGGVVNVIDNRIPAEPITGFTGAVEPRYGGADDERSIGAVLEGGNGTFSFHADGFTRKTDELRIPGYAHSARQRALDGPGTSQPKDRLPNSDQRADGGALGASVSWGSGHVGLSYQGYSSNYGSVPEPDVRIDMDSTRWDLAGEARELGTVLTGAKFKLSRTDYEHREQEDGAVNTTFSNEGYEGRLEISHAPIGKMKGAFGVQFGEFDFKALGAEAFVPSTKTDATGLFVYEELPADAWTLSAGLRGDRVRVSSQGGGPADPGTGLPRFDPEQSRRFTPVSGALGALYRFGDALVGYTNLSYTERAPTYYELFANGPHAATGTYEVGDTALAKEKSTGVDLGLRWRSGKHSARAGVFYTRFSNYIGLFDTGSTRGADGELNPVDVDGDGVADASGEEILPEFAYLPVRAEFKGIEALGRWRLTERAGALDLELRGDIVRATDRTNGEPLPRIPPARLGAALDYARNRFGARAELVYAFAQNRTGPNELPTDSYTLVNLYADYLFSVPNASLRAFARLNNLFDEEARNHSSFIKDIAPLPGRGLLVGLRGSF